MDFIKKIFSQILLLLTIFIGASVNAQENNKKDILLKDVFTRDFQQGNYLSIPLTKEFFNTGISRLEGGFYPNIKIIDKKTKKNRPIELDVLFQLTFRMYKESSSPIYPLNYEPGIRFTRYFLKESKDTSSFISFDLRHFSNGQSGSFYINNSDSVNLRSGNFSTNYIMPSYTRIYRTKSDFIFLYQLGVRFDWGIPNTVLEKSDGLENIYGNYRFQANLQAESPKFSLFDKNKKYKLIFRVENTYIAGKLTKPINNSDEGDDLERYSIKARLFLKPLQGVKAGIFLQYYNGRDYYNLRFTQETRNLSLGIIYNF